MKFPVLTRKEKEKLKVEGGESENRTSGNKVSLYRRRFPSPNGYTELKILW